MCKQNSKREAIISESFAVKYAFCFGLQVAIDFIDKLHNLNVLLCPSA